MKAKSHVYSASSGSVAGTTHLRGRTGLVVRSKAMPVRKRQPKNTDVTNICNQLRMVWLETLTESQREAWREYARQTPKINALGASRHIVGWQWFGGCNAVRRQFGFSLALDAPTLFARGPLGPLTFSFSVPLNRFLVSWNATERWPDLDGAALLIWASHGGNITVNRYRGSYAAFATILGSSSTPPVSPVELAPQDNQAPVTRVHFKVRAIYPDGRYSSKQFGSAIRETPEAQVLSVTAIGSNSYDWLFSEPMQLLSSGADSCLRTSGGPPGNRTATAVNVIPSSVVRTNMGASGNGQTAWSMPCLPSTVATVSGNLISIPQSGSVI